MSVTRRDLPFIVAWVAFACPHADPAYSANAVCTDPSQGVGQYFPKKAYPPAVLSRLSRRVDITAVQLTETARATQ